MGLGVQGASGKDWASIALTRGSHSPVLLLQALQSHLHSLTEHLLLSGATLAQVAEERPGERKWGEYT